MFFALLSLHVAWMSYFMKMPTGNNSSSSILKQELKSKIKISSQNQNQPKNIIILPFQLQKLHNLLYFLRKLQYQRVIMTQLQLFTVRNLQHPHLSIYLIGTKQDTKHQMQMFLEISNFKRRTKKMLERLMQLKPSLLLLVMNLFKDIFLLKMFLKNIKGEVKNKSIGYRI